MLSGKNMLKIFDAIFSDRLKGNAMFSEERLFSGSTQKTGLCSVVG